MTGISFEDGIKYADYILENSNEHEHLVHMWRNECLIRRATYVMLKQLKDRYEEETETKK
jgi:hypothetical protein